MTLAHVAGAALIAYPFIAVTVIMWVVDGLRSVLVVWGLVLAVIAAVVFGVDLLRK